MRLIALKETDQVFYINPDAVTCVYQFSTETRVEFGKEDYITFSQPIQQIIEKLQGYVPTTV